LNVSLQLFHFLPIMRSIFNISWDSENRIFIHYVSPPKNALISKQIRTQPGQQGNQTVTSPYLRWSLMLRLERYSVLGNIWLLCSLLTKAIAAQLHCYVFPWLPLGKFSQNVTRFLCQIAKSKSREICAFHSREITY